MIATDVACARCSQTRAAVVYSFQLGEHVCFECCGPELADQDADLIRLDHDGQPYRLAGSAETDGTGQQPHVVGDDGPPSATAATPDWWAPRPVSSFQARPIFWLWEPYLPAGRPAILSGREGLGKSLVVCWLAARATRGEFTGSRHGQPARVAIVAAEDDVAETWKPHLYAAGADLDLVEFQDADPIEDLAADGAAEAIAAWAIERDVALVVFDALLDHLGGPEVDEYRPRHVRRAMKPLRLMARASGAAVLGLLHPPKGGGSDYRSHVAASHQFVAVARTGLLLAPDPDGDSERELVLLRGKGNLGPQPPALRLRIETRQLALDGHTFERPLVCGFDPCDLTLDDLFAGKSSSDRGERALDELAATLEQNPDGLSQHEIEAVLDLPRSTAQSQLYKLREQGRARVIEQGRGRKPTVWGPGE